MRQDEIVLGVDIGGTTTAFGFVDRNGRLLRHAVIPTLADEPAEALLARLYKGVETLRAGVAPGLKWKGVGIGAPNANYLCGTVENPPNLKWGERVPLAELVRSRYDLPVVITNDANAAALGEMYYGGARGMQDFMVITLGTGLGSGIVVHGELVYGASGFAGELGHTIVDPEGRECGCGKRGCLETYVSASGLCRTAFALLAESRDASPLRGRSFQQLTSRDIYEAACAGDAIALQTFERTARILGMKLADAVAHTSPGAIFLFGGVAAAGELLLTPTRRYLEEFLFPPYRGKVQLLISEMEEGVSAILGAAALVWHEVEREERRREV